MRLISQFMKGCLVGWGFFLSLKRKATNGRRKESHQCKEKPAICASANDSLLLGFLCDALCILVSSPAALPTSPYSTPRTDVLHLGH